MNLFQVCALCNLLFQHEDWSSLLWWQDSDLVISKFENLHDECSLLLIRCIVGNSAMKLCCKWAWLLLLLLLQLRLRFLSWIARIISGSLARIRWELPWRRNWWWHTSLIIIHCHWHLVRHHAHVKIHWTTSNLLLTTRVNKTRISRSS